jgi:hypothetical protein
MPAPRTLHRGPKSQADVIIETFLTWFGVAIFISVVVAGLTAPFWA